MEIKKLKKEQYLIAALAAVLLVVIAIPVPKEDVQRESDMIKSIEAETDEKLTEQRLKEVLQTISGVGKVEIFITYEDQGQLILEKDETVSEELTEESDGSGGTRKTTTTQTERQTIYDGNDAPYIIREMEPSVQGVLVVAQGGGNPDTKKKIESTIEALFGLEKHKISIMKMEGLK